MNAPSLRDPPDSEIVEKLYDSLGFPCSTDPNVAHVEVHANRVVGTHLVEGLHVEADSVEEGMRVRLRVDPGIHIQEPVRICFGMLPEEGRQLIDMDVDIGEGARVAIMAWCTFPNATDVLHRMEARIRVGRGAEYAYLERHVHGSEGGVNVVPHAQVEVGENARFTTDFELVKGRVGRLDIDYDTTVQAGGIMDMNARVNGLGADRIRIREAAHLAGEGAHGVLTTVIALRDDARADIDNELVADAPYARGHVDCKEIVQGRAVARAVPVVEVRHPKAHVTHEAAIGSVDSKQLETLMSRGLDEDAATDLIIQGLLSPPRRGTRPS